MLSLNLPLANQQDRWVWTPDSKGLFTVKSCYLCVLPPPFVSDSLLAPAEWKGLWKLSLHAQLKILLWKLVCNVIPTRSRVGALLTSSAEPSCCPLCLSKVETIQHLLISCTFSRITWLDSPWVLDSLSFALLSIPAWIKIILNPCVTIGIPRADSSLFQLFAALLADLVWFQWNQIVHGTPSCSVWEFSVMVLRVFNEH